MQQNRRLKEEANAYIARRALSLSQQGLTARDIARSLGRSPSTIENILARAGK